MTERITPICQCGDPSRPHINHRVRVPCWTYLGHQRFDVNADGLITGGGQVESRLSRPVHEDAGPMHWRGHNPSDGSERSD